MPTSELAPICLFVYSRLSETKLTIESLQKNILASKSQLFIFSDGAKDYIDNERVQSVREYIQTIEGFAHITIYESEVNLGLANSIISGIEKIISKYNKVIVVEDDLILSSNFLNFMNQALNFYKENKRVLSISGYSFQLKYPDGYNYDVAVSLRASSWGWATWSDRWEQIDWDMKDYSSFRWNLLKHIKFNLGGSDLTHMLHRQMNGMINSWAIRFVYHQYKYKYVDVFPTKSKVINNGFTTESTHTKLKSDRFDTLLDTSNQTTFLFSKEVKVNKYIAIQFYKHYSLYSRLKTKIQQKIWMIKE